MGSYEDGEDDDGEDGEADGEDMELPYILRYTRVVERLCTLICIIGLTA